MRRRPLPISLLVAGALAVVACSDGGGVEVVSTETTAPAEPAGGASTDTRNPRSPRGEGQARQDLTVEAGFTSALDALGTRHTTAGALVTNPNPRLGAYDVSVIFNLLDASGAVVDTETARIDYIPAGATVPAAPFLLGFDTPEPVVVDVDTVADLRPDEGWAGVDFALYDGIELQTSDPLITPGPVGAEFAFTATNPSTTTVAENGSWSCVFRQGPVIVGGETSGIADPVVPGGSVRVSTFLDVDSIPADNIVCRAYA